MVENNEPAESNGFKIPEDNCFTFVDNDEGKIIGALKIKDGKLEFEGNAEASAMVFLDMLKNLWREEIENLLPPRGEKYPFQTMADLHSDDIKNDSKNIAVCTTFLSADKITAGARITMGAPLEMLLDIMNDKRMPILVIVDREEFAKRKAADG